MNFDLDDPLEGLLSDGSNDSLFGNETAKKAAKPSKPSKMEDLFGIKSNEATKGSTFAKSAEPGTSSIDKIQPVSLDYTKPTASSVQQPSSLSSVPSKKADTPIRKQEPTAAAMKPSTPQKKEISFDDGDLLSDLGFDPKKPKSKSSILDDILGGSLVASTKEIPAKSVLAKPRHSLTTTMAEPAAVGKTISRQSTETSDNQPTESGGVMGAYAPSGSGASGAALPRRSGRRQSSVSTLNDPLGLFASTSEDKSTRRESKQLGKKSGADWLGLNDDGASLEADPVPVLTVPAAKQPEKSAPNVSPATVAKVHEVIPDHPAQVIPKQPEAVKPQPVIPPIVTDPIVTVAQPFSTSLQLVEAETQNALAAMLQQEFQLSVAGQLKNQEHALLDMQQKQQAILRRQEAQFNELLQKQMQRHSALEDMLTKQQQRINANIQLIMSQPVTMATTSYPPEHHPPHAPEKDPGESPEEDPGAKVELQTDVKRLEMEKLRLEDLLANLAANHEQELSLLESSYKKQASFLEDSMKIMEVRLRNDTKQLEEFYKAKVDALEQEKLKLVQMHAGKVREIEDSHQKVIEKMKQTYEENLEQLRQDHREMIGSIRESKMLEFSAVQENQSYLQALRSASSYLENASGDIQQLRDTLQDQIEFAQKEKERQLEAREKQVADQQRLIERTREAAAEENVRMLNLIEMLESKVTEMTKASSEERWEFQQKFVKLEAERQGFEKEKQFLRERQQREEDRIAELKQMQLEEHARLMDKVNQERQTLLEERAKLETMAQLQSKSLPVAGGGGSRVEVEAALKVAEEAARQADVEKERYLQLQRQFEAKRRELMTRESKLRESTDEMESAIERARLRERNAENVYRSLRRAEQNVQLKVELVQRQFREVSEREDRLAKDKIELSKERLELQATRRKLQQTRCSLCKIGEKSQEIGELLTTNTDSVADDLKLEANFAEMQNRLDTTGGLKLDHFFDSDVDQQMKLFLERNRVEQNLGLADLNEMGPSEQRHRRELDEDLAMLKFDTLFPQSQRQYDDAERRDE
ncbi:fas-binding factor 1 homolog [Anopheles ziemanni]|uniref:fas-binding factor 1 homolog n=1 Tax=Anopheles coustani TaxID=139045 RepID=UPI0026592795|nr:fas-binding factor 1 homolog [Anopheles coustani]XP_058169993.1 fas-binding factor 1 homolog [Anopheles ziemanni]